MRAVIQRVTKSSVVVDGNVVGDIDKGLLILLGVGPEDDSKDIDYLSDKIVNLRIFEDEDNKMNLSLLDIEGDLLIVSQFTLLGDVRKGRRPNFSNAAKPDIAEKMYEDFIEKCKSYEGLNKVESGVFGADMKVELLNDGPVTILIDSKKLF